MIPSMQIISVNVSFIYNKTCKSHFSTNMLYVSLYVRQVPISKMQVCIACEVKVAHG